MSSRPNIVYIHAHDTGRYISPHGYGFKTPNLQKLAEQGVLFKKNFCVAPGSSQSRACLLTGTYPHQNGMIGLIHRGFALRDHKEHLVHTLQAEGYQTILAGIEHVAMAKGEQQGWERIGYNDCLSECGDAHVSAAQYLDQVDSNQPFFLSVGFFENLREFPEIDETICDPRYCQPPASIPDTPETREETARYAASVYAFDQKLGAVLEAIERNNLSDNTLVICTTTNGLSFPEMKCSLNDEGVGTFLIIRGPRGFEGGKVIDAMTSHLDVFPTICELIAADKPARLEGKSLLPLVNGELDKIHDQLFFQINYHAGYEPTRAVRTGRYKYVRRYTQLNKVVPANCDDGETKKLFINAGWSDVKVSKEQLYDLTLDVNEQLNLANSPDHSAVFTEMKKTLDSWMMGKTGPDGVWLS